MIDCLGINYESKLRDQKKERWLKRHSEKYIEKNKNIQETMEYIEGTKDGHRGINRDMRELLDLRHDIIKGKFVEGQRKITKEGKSLKFQQMLETAQVNKFFNLGNNNIRVQNNEIVQN